MGAFITISFVLSERTIIKHTVFGVCFFGFFFFWRCAKKKSIPSTGRPSRARWNGGRSRSGSQSLKRTRRNAKPFRQPPRAEKRTIDLDAAVIDLYFPLKRKPEREGREKAHIFRGKLFFHFCRFDPLGIHYSDSRCCSRFPRESFHSCVILILFGKMRPQCAERVDD